MTAPDRDGASEPYALRWKALGVLALSLLVISLDNTILNTAIPSLRDDLGASAGELQWIVDSYLLVFAGLLLTAGSLGDRFGRKRALQFGLARVRRRIGRIRARWGLRGPHRSAGPNGQSVAPSSCLRRCRSSRRFSQPRSDPRRSPRGRQSQASGSFSAPSRVASCSSTSAGAQSSGSMSRWSPSRSSPASG